MRIHSFLSLAAIMLCVGHLIGCSDSDESPAASSTPDASTKDTGTKDAAGKDASPLDSSTADSSTADSATNDSALDSAQADSSPVDAQTADTSADSQVTDAKPDSTAVDSSSVDAKQDSQVVDSAADSSVADAKTDSQGVDAKTDSQGADTGVIDSSLSDSSAIDSSAADSSKPDTSTSDGSAEASVDASTPSTVQISELFLARALQGDLSEWIEIAAPAGTPLDDIVLRHYKWTSASKPTVLQFTAHIADKGAVMPKSGLWVVGGTLAPYTDKTLSIGSDKFGFDSDSGSIQLYRASTKELLDAIGYGSAQPAVAPSEPATTMFLSPAPICASGEKNQSTARHGSSSNNAADFCLQLATPGSANGACL